MKKKVLQCVSCMSLNYKLNNSNSNNITRVKKYCKKCRNRIMHVETK